MLLVCWLIASVPILLLDCGKIMAGSRSAQNNFGHASVIGALLPTRPRRSPPHTMPRCATHKAVRAIRPDSGITHPGLGGAHHKAALWRIGQRYLSDTSDLTSGITSAIPRDTSTLFVPRFAPAPPLTAPFTSRRLLLDVYVLTSTSLLTSIIFFFQRYRPAPLTGLQD